MKIETAEDAIDAYKSLGEWEYADREAAWKWMFEQGRISEREACAKACHSIAVDNRVHALATRGAFDCEKAIKARSNAEVTGGPLAARPVD